MAFLRTMPLKVRQVVAISEIMKAFCKQDATVSFEFPQPHVRVAFAEILRSIKAAVFTYNSERNGYLMKLGTKQADGSWGFGPSNTPESRREYEVVMTVVEDRETDVQITPILLSDLGNAPVAVDIIAGMLDAGILVKTV